MVRHETSEELQIKFHFYGSADWGRSRGYGEGARDTADGKMVMRLFYILEFCPRIWGVDTTRWNNGDEFFTCGGGGRRWPVGGDPVPACHPQIKCPTHN